MDQDEIQALIDDPKMFKQAFLQRLGDAGIGMEKVAEATSMMTRRKLREDAFSPAIIPYDDIQISDLSDAIDERIYKIYEMEADSFGVKNIPFEGAPDTMPYEGNKYTLQFYSNTTPEWTKNVLRLMTYDGDLRQLLTDNSLRDLSRKKDVKFMKEVDAICGAIRGGVSKYGFEQNVVYGGGLTRDNFVSACQLLRDRQLTTGVILCNARTFNEFTRWGRNEMGGDMAQELIMKGTRKFETAEMFGIKFIVTMKHDLVPNGVMYQFAPPNYLGRAGVLQKPTMFIRKDKDILRFSCMEKIGVTIANVAGVQKVTFLSIANATGGDGRIQAADL